MRPTGTYAFNKMLAFVLGHLGIFLPTATGTLPDWLKILDGVTTTGKNLTASEPAMGGKPVTEFIDFSFDRLSPARRAQ